MYFDKKCFLEVVEQNQVEDPLAMSIANMIMSRCLETNLEHASILQVSGL